MLFALLPRDMAFSINLSVIMPQVRISFMSTSFEHHDSALLPTSNITPFLTYGSGQGNTSGNTANILPLSSKKAGSKNIRESRLTVCTHVDHDNVMNTVPIYLIVKCYCSQSSQADFLPFSNFHLPK